MKQRRWACLGGGWLLSGLAAILCCGGPEPQPLSLQDDEDVNRAIRQEMTEFHAARFQVERSLLDSLRAASGKECVELPGGIWVAWVRGDVGEGRGAFDLGQPVTWDWRAFTTMGTQVLHRREVARMGDGTVPAAWDEVAQRLAPGDSVVMWVPSFSAFGPRGIPGTVPPFTPLVVHATVTSAADALHLPAGKDEGALLQQWVAAHAPLATEVEDGVWVEVLPSSAPQARESPGSLLRIETQNAWGHARRHATHLDWQPGAPNQVVSALEVALSAFPSASRLNVYAVSTRAFGEGGVPQAEILPNTPLVFELEFAPRSQALRTANG